MYCPSVLVDPPTITPYRYGLFSVASIPPEPIDPQWQCGGYEYVTHACSEASTWDPDCESPAEKPVQGALSVVHADPFVVLAGPQCDLISSSLAEIEQSAREALRLGEQRAVEERLWQRLSQCCDADGYDESPAECCDDGQPCCRVLNTVEGPEGALSVTAGLAALEEYAANHYGGVPVIHSPRGMAAFTAAAGLIHRGNGVIETTVGSRWAMYGASLNTGPCGQAAPPGTAWMYATGAVTIRRGDVFVTPPRARDGFDHRHNRATVLAERLYAVSYECVCAAVLVTASCLC